jgi:hypothetical protein
MKLSKLSRLLHRWGSIIALLPITIIIFSGIVLQLKNGSPKLQRTSVSNLPCDFLGDQKSNRLDLTPFPSLRFLCGSIMRRQAHLLQYPQGSQFSIFC